MRKNRLKIESLLFVGLSFLLTPMLKAESCGDYNPKVLLGEYRGINGIGEPCSVDIDHFDINTQAMLINVNIGSERVSGLLLQCNLNQFDEVGFLGRSENGASIVLAWNESLGGPFSFLLYESRELAYRGISKFDCRIK